MGAVAPSSLTPNSVSQFPPQLRDKIVIINFRHYDLNPVPQIVNTLCIFYISLVPELNVVLGDKRHQLLRHQLQKKWKGVFSTH